MLKEITILTPDTLYDARSGIHANIMFQGSELSARAFYLFRDIGREISPLLTLDLILPPPYQDPLVREFEQTLTPADEQTLDKKLAAIGLRRNTPVDEAVLADPEWQKKARKFFVARFTEATAAYSLHQKNPLNDERLGKQAGTVREAGIREATAALFKRVWPSAKTEQPVVQPVADRPDPAEDLYRNSDGVDVHGHPEDEIEHPSFTTAIRGLKAGTKIEPAHPVVR